MVQDFPDWRLPTVWTGQEEAVWPAPVWFALKAKTKNVWAVSVELPDGAQFCAPKYTVPADKLLFIYGFGGAALYGGRVCALIRIAAVTYAEVCAEAAILVPGVPWVAVAGDDVEVCVINRTGISTSMAGYWWGWEL